MTTVAGELTLADQLHQRAADLRSYADRLDDMAGELDGIEVPPILTEMALAAWGDTQVSSPEAVSVEELRVRDVIRIPRRHGDLGEPVTVAAVDADAARQSSLPAIDGRRPLALRERSGDLNIGWHEPHHTVQLVWRPAPLEDERPNDLDLFRERQHEAQNGGL